MSERFNPVADWPLLPALGGYADFRSLALDARARVTADLTPASALYPLARSLNSTRAASLARELLECVVAVDCWNAGTCSPRHRQGSAPATWQEFLTQRLAGVLDPLGRALRGNAVLESIPVQWVPARPVRAQLTVALRDLGYEAEVLELTLTPPTPGGHEWLRRDCERNLPLPADLARRLPLAAILYWHDEVTPAVVDGVDGQLRAFGPAFEIQGTPFSPSEVLGADCISSAMPPKSRVQYLAGALGLSRMVRFWTRSKRLRKGDSPFAPR